MVDYGLLPPEINSARIYAGPGPETLIAAAAAWTGLAADLQDSVAGSRSVVAALMSGPWTGPAAASAAASISPFITWLDISGEEAADAASKASAAVSAYETAFAATVPPPLIAANRALLAELTATNIFGQNTPSIGQLEAQYSEFWAQDSGAMYTYAGSSAAATQLTPLPAAPEVVDPGALADQAIAVFKAQYQALQSNIMGTMNQVNPRVSDVLKTLCGPMNGPAMDAWIVANTPLDDIVPLYSKYLSPYINSVAALTQSTQTVGQNASGFSGIGGLANTLFKPAAPAAAAAGAAASGAGQAAGQAATGAAGGLGGIAGALAKPAGALGQALPIGGLSVPASWTPWHATTNPGVAALASSTMPAAAEGANSYPMAPPFGQFVNGGYGKNVPTYGFKPLVMAKPPAAG